MFVIDPLIGADIEVFLSSKEDGSFVSAEGIIPGTKDEPFIFDETNKHHAISLDNVMPEFCIPPATTPAEFYFGIEKALKYIESIIPKNLEINIVPAAYFDEKYLLTENALKFGCDPDFNAWLNVQNDPPPSSSNLRTAGFHVHVGYRNPTNFVNTSIAKAMDIFLGVPAVLLEPENDRKKLYGKAGAHREKAYGMEYRVLSNHFCNNDKLTSWVFQNTKRAIDFVNAGNCISLNPEDKDKIVDCINKKDKELALDLINKYNIKLAA